MILRPASVLVPVIVDEENVIKSILFTVRSNHVSTHKGQICFPGGSLEPDDKDHISAALRETQEEIGISKKEINVISTLEGCITYTGFKIIPTVGLIKANYTLKPCKEEVADTFEFPIDMLKNYDHLEMLRKLKEVASANKTKKLSGFKDVNFRYKDYVIWGATAVITCQLLELLSNQNSLTNPQLHESCYISP